MGALQLNKPQLSSDKPYGGVGAQIAPSSNKSKMMKVKKGAYDSRSVGRRNAGNAASTSVGRKDKRDASTIRKERV